MLIIGAKGFAKEVLEVFHQNNNTNNISFYDDVNIDIGKYLFEEFPILKNESEVLKFFTEYGNDFTIGIGDPHLRFKIYNKFIQLGGIYISTISPFSRIGNYGNSIGEGSNIMTGTVITNDVKIGKGVLINLNCTIGHDSELEDFVELSPGVHISGYCKIGNFTNIGTNATILPKINIGSNVIIGAGSVVTKDIPDNSIALGVPAKVVKTI
jgi:sugar O-acyltransferase (sialic acid O-acetyltransferase NeuD family)